MPILHSCASAGRRCGFFAATLHFPTGQGTGEDLTIFPSCFKNQINRAEISKSLKQLLKQKTKAETFERALKEALDHFGKVDFLINYAGGALKVAPIEEMDDVQNVYHNLKISEEALAALEEE